MYKGTRLWILRLPEVEEIAFDGAAVLYRFVDYRIPFNTFEQALGAVRAFIRHGYRLVNYGA